MQSKDLKDSKEKQDKRNYHNIVKYCQNKLIIM